LFATLAIKIRSAFIGDMIGKGSSLHNRQIDLVFGLIPIRLASSVAVIFVLEIAHGVGSVEHRDGTSACAIGVIKTVNVLVPFRRKGLHEDARKCFVVNL